MASRAVGLLRVTTVADEEKGYSMTMAMEMTTIVVESADNDDSRLD